MEPVKKTQLRKEISELETKIEIEAIIRQQVEKFKHYKQVNKRFSDAISEIEGYRAWTYKDNKHSITVRRELGQYKCVDVQLYVYGKDLTWETMIEDLDKHRYSEQLFNVKKQLEMLDMEIEYLKEIRKYIGDTNLLNFGLYSITRELDHAIQYSGE